MRGKKGGKTCKWGGEGVLFGKTLFTISTSTWIKRKQKDHLIKIFIILLKNFKKPLSSLISPSLFLVFFLTFIKIKIKTLDSIRATPIG